MKYSYLFNKTNLWQIEKPELKNIRIAYDMTEFVDMKPGYENPQWPDLAPVKDAFKMKKHLIWYLFNKTNLWQIGKPELNRWIVYDMTRVCGCENPQWPDLAPVKDAFKTK